jgi:hypothetical protein
MSEFANFVAEYPHQPERPHNHSTSLDVNGLGSWLQARARRGLPQITTLRDLTDYLDVRCASPAIRRSALPFWKLFERSRRKRGAAR